MTPYRFALARILFGFYLFGFFISESLKRDSVVSTSIYWGLAAFSVLLLLGYQRQLVSRAIFFFSFLLFVFKRTELHLNSSLILVLLLLLIIVPGDEPWQVKDSTKLSRTPVQLKSAFFWFALVLVIAVTIIGLIFDTEPMMGDHGQMVIQKMDYFLGGL